VVAEDPTRAAGFASQRRAEHALRFVGPASGASSVSGLHLTPAQGQAARKIRGPWTPDPRTLAANAPFFPLVAMAFNQRDREFGWTALDLRGRPADEVSSFEIAAAALAPPEEDPQSTFVLAAVPGPLLGATKVAP